MSRFTRVYNRLYAYVLHDDYKTARYLSGFTIGAGQIASYHETAFGDTPYNGVYKYSIATACGCFYGYCVSRYLPAVVAVEVAFDGGNAVGNYIRNRRT